MKRTIMIVLLSLLCTTSFADTLFNKGDVVVMNKKGKGIVSKSISEKTWTVLQEDAGVVTIYDPATKENLEIHRTFLILSPRKFSNGAPNNILREVSLSYIPLCRGSHSAINSPLSEENGWTHAGGNLWYRRIY